MLTNYSNNLIKGFCHKVLDSYYFLMLALGVMRKVKIMNWMTLNGLKDKKKILSLLDKWPSLKKSFYNDYNGDFSKVVFDVLAPHAFMMVPK